MAPIYFKYCEFLDPRQEIYKVSTRNYDFTTGINLWGAYGDSQAGWSTETQLYIKNTSTATRGIICWPNGAGIGASPYMEGRL